MDGRAVRWQRHNDERRQRIVAAAIELIEAEGTQVSLQSIGERAGLSRSVVYRHFADRRELDVAVQAYVLEGLWAELLPSVELSGTVRQTVERAIGVYVGWAVAHPRLHQLADVDIAADGNGPLQQGIDMIAARIGEVVVVAFQLAGARISPADLATADPLIHGLVGMVFGTVRRWVHLGEQIPSAECMVALLTESVIVLLVTRARGFGLELDADVPIEELVATASMVE